MLHVHHDLDLAVALRVSPHRFDYGSDSGSGKGTSGRGGLKFDSDEVGDSEASPLLQLQMERAGAQVRGVAMHTPSSAAGGAAPSALLGVQSTGDLVSPHMLRPPLPPRLSSSPRQSECPIALTK